VNELLPFVVSGLATGAVYGMTATGLVLTYKTSGIFNLAHGALAAAGAYSFYELRTVHGLPWPLALAVCLLLVAPLSGTVLYGLTRGLAGASTAAKLVATVGLLLAVQGLLVAAKGASNIYFPPFLPTGTFRVLGVNVGFDQLIVTVVAAAAAGGLFCFFRVSRLGIAMRASGSTPSCSRCWPSRPTVPPPSGGSRACRSPSPGACSSVSPPICPNGSWPTFRRWPASPPACRSSCCSPCSSSPPEANWSRPGPSPPAGQPTIGPSPGRWSSVDGWRPWSGCWPSRTSSAPACPSSRRP
jgi:hypothetical protein